MTKKKKPASASYLCMNRQCVACKNAMVATADSNGKKDSKHFLQRMLGLKVRRFVIDIPGAAGRPRKGGAMDDKAHVNKE